MVRSFYGKVIFRGVSGLEIIFYFYEVVFKIDDLLHLVVSTFVKVDFH